MGEKLLALQFGFLFTCLVLPFLICVLHLLDQFFLKKNTPLFSLNMVLKAVKKLHLFSGY